MACVAGGKRAEPRHSGASGTLVNGNSSLALVFLRAGGSLSATAALQETAPPPTYSRRFRPSLMASEGRSSGFIMYNTCSASMAKTASCHRRIERWNIPEERHPHMGLWKVRASGSPSHSGSGSASHQEG
jgi:hypothetical protein